MHVSNALKVLNSKKKLKKYDANWIRDTRASIITHPLQNKNVVGTTETVNVNTLVKHGDSFYVGGDTAIYEFDFSTKVANSVAECPIKISWNGGASSPLAPDSVYWAEETDQASIDKLKLQDGIAHSRNVNVADRMTQIKIELDLNPLATKLGLTNAALKTAIKTIGLDALAKGEGNNVGALAYGVIAKIFSTAWIDWASYTGIAIDRIPTSVLTTSNSVPSNYIDANNKLNILLHAKYTSNGTIASKVDLDYVKITIQLARVPDTVSPIPVNLPKYWAMLVKGFASKPKLSDIANNKRIFTLTKPGDNTNAYDLLVYSGKAIFINVQNGVNKSLANVVTKTPDQYKCINLLVGRNQAGLYAHSLVNDNILEKVSIADTFDLYGLMNLQILSHPASTGFNNDAFIESFTLFDMTPKLTGFTDVEAALMLKGVANFNDCNLIANGDFSHGTNGWTGAPALSVVDGICKYTAASQYAGATYNIPNYPAYVGHKMYYAADLKTDSVDNYLVFNDGVSQGLMKPIGNGNWQRLSGVWTVSAGAKNLFIKIQDARTSGWTPTECDNFMVADLTALFGAGNEPTKEQFEAMFGITNGVVNKELFDINKVKLHTNARLAEDKIILDAKANNDNSTIDIKVLPNNSYEIKCQTNGYVHVYDMCNGVSINLRNGLLSSSKSAATFVTSQNCNTIRIYFSNSTTTIGHFEFSDISLKLKM